MLYLDSNVMFSPRTYNENISRYYIITFFSNTCKGINSSTPILPLSLKIPIMWKYDVGSLTLKKHVKRI